MPDVSKLLKMPSKQMKPTMVNRVVMLDLNREQMSLVGIRTVLPVFVMVNGVGIQACGRDRGESEEILIEELSMEHLWSIEAHKQKELQ